MHRGFEGHAAVSGRPTAAEEAMANNERPETQANAERFRAVATSEPEWRNFDELYRTPFA